MPRKVNSYRTPNPQTPKEEVEKKLFEKQKLNTRVKEQGKQTAKS
jgi:hypothetical protein